jgi:hypothetical protein
MGLRDISSSSFGIASLSRWRFKKRHRLFLHFRCTTLEIVASQGLVDARTRSVRLCRHPESVLAKVVAKQLAHGEVVHRDNMWTTRARGAPLRAKRAWTECGRVP